MQAMHCALASYARCDCAVLVLNSLHVYKAAPGDRGGHPLGGCRSALQTKVQPALMSPSNIE